MEKKTGLKAYTGYIPAVSLALAATGQVLMYCFKLVLLGMFFFAAAAALIAVYGREDRGEKNAKLPLKTEIVAAAVIFGMAAFFRLLFLDHVPAGCYTD